MESSAAAAGPESPGAPATRPAAAVRVAALESPGAPGTRPAGGVRVVGRIGAGSGGGGGGGGGLFRVGARVLDADSSAVVSFAPLLQEATAGAGPGSTPTRKEHDYRLDGCYLRDDTHRHIFDREVKPLVDAAFRGTNACVVTCGAASKTNLMMGSDDQSGLVTMAMERMVELSKTRGAAISVSSYHVLPDNQVFDLLGPKDNEVLVLEGDGKTHLKNLSRVDVKSVNEFANLCCCANGSGSLQQPTKASNKLQARGEHQGFIFYISKFDEQAKAYVVAKINFLDLAGYVVPKQKNNGGGLAVFNANKSMKALMDVVWALNSNQYICYRQCKLTRILQDSLCKTSGAVLIACLDEVSNQEAISALSMASRSSQVVNEKFYSLLVGSRGSLKSNVNPSASAKKFSRTLLPGMHQSNSVLVKQSRVQFNNSGVKASRTPATNKRFEATMHSDKKHAGSVYSSIKTKSHIKSTMTGRKLFCPITDPSTEAKNVVAPPVETNDEGWDETEKAMYCHIFGMPKMVPCSMQELVSIGTPEKENCSSRLQVERSCIDLSETCSSDITDDLTEKTLKLHSEVDEEMGEISNSLKLLTNRPAIKTQQKMANWDTQCFGTDVPELTTPEARSKFEDPQELLKARSAGIQKSLAEECLTFLNSANKEQLKSLKRIGEKRANIILNLREKSSEPFKEIDDLKSIGMKENEIKKMMLGIMDSYHR
ncbi:hypothetical protein ACP4OV_017048 [Aristida adscensionis]